jgi:hypothetical protein
MGNLLDNDSAFSKSYLKHFYKTHQVKNTSTNESGVSIYIAQVQLIKKVKTVFENITSNEYEELEFSLTKINKLISKIKTINVYDKLVMLEEKLDELSFNEFLKVLRNTRKTRKNEKPN